MKAHTTRRNIRPFMAIVLASLVLAVLPVGSALPATQAQKYAQAQARAQEPSMTFAETGKTVRGRFLRYWAENGSTVVQGLPISEELQERSDADGKTYAVQYFERAVFERHPENKEPYGVLLSLLGTFRYKEKYAQGGPEQPEQAARVTGGARFFPETGKWLACEFADFWSKYGGLAQFGYPISNMFVEQSQVDGMRYSVQYFQRSVLEYRLEGVVVARSYSNVAVAPLGTLHYAARYSADRLPPSIASQAAGKARCTPTAQTAYLRQPPADAPMRSSVGKGHVLRGVVRSSKDCSVIAGARIIFSVPGSKEGEYLAATVFTGKAGEYTFESNAPGASSSVRLRAAGLAAPPAKPAGGGIMLYVSAEGYKPTGTGIGITCHAADTVLDLVLAPAEP